MKEMKDDFLKLSKSQLIKLLLKQNLEMKKLSTKRNIIQPPLDFRDYYKPIPTPRKNVKQMIQCYEENIIQPPLAFRDKPVPAPRKNTHQMVQEYEDKITQPPLEFRDDSKPIPLPRTKIVQAKIALKGYTKFSLVNELIPGHCAQINQGFGEHINSNLVKKAGSVRKMYRNAKNSRERNQLDQKTLKIKIEEWRRKVEDLESKKRELMKEMHGALKEKDDEMAKLREQNAALIQHIDNLEKRLGEVGCTGKKLGDLGSRQRHRKLKELKSRAEVALWFVKSYGLELTCLKGVDTEHGNSYTVDLTNEPSATPNTDKEEDEKLEQVLYLLDKFCASDELYHELTMICDDLPKSYLIKQK